MSSSLSNLIDNLSEGLHSDKCIDFKFCLDYMATKDEEQLIFRCFDCKKNYKKDFNKELINGFSSTYKLCNEDNLFCYKEKVFISMNTWIVEKSLPNKEAFYSSLNMEDITDVDHRHAKRVFKNLSNKNLSGSHDFYVQSDTLLLADVFKNFRYVFIKVYELDPAHFLSAPGLAWQACLKKAEARLESLTDIDMLLMVEKGITGEICHAIHRYAKANNKYMKDYDENKESSFREYLDAKNLYGWTMSERLLVYGFDRIKDLSKIDEDFIKSYDKDSDKGYILELDVEYPKNYMICHIVIYHSYQKE